MTNLSRYGISQLAHRYSCSKATPTLSPLLPFHLMLLSLSLAPMTNPCAFGMCQGVYRCRCSTATPWVSAQLHSRLMVHISPLALMTNPSRYGISEQRCNCRYSMVTLILLLPLCFHLTILGSFLAPGTSQYGCGMYQKASSCRCSLVNSTMSPPSRFQPMAWILYQALLTNLYIWRMPWPVKPNQPLWTQISNWIVSSSERDYLMWVPNVALTVRDKTIQMFVEVGLFLE